MPCFHSAGIPVLLYLRFLEILDDKLYQGTARRFMDYCQCFEINLRITFTIQPKQKKKKNATTAQSCLRNLNCFNVIDSM